VIADDNGVESLAGIMGGEASGCDEDTTDVLIESALGPAEHRALGRKLGINSDARYRFERGVDPAFMLPGLELATRLVQELCGGEASEIVVTGNVPEPHLTIAFPIAEVKRLAGIDPTEDEIRNVLTALGFSVSGSAPSLTVARAVLAPGCRRQGRSGRGSHAHPRRRSRAFDAAAEVGQCRRSRS
jgi:phenylalanyl-tRNA synthetase beta chain